MTELTVQDVKLKNQPVKPLPKTKTPERKSQGKLRKLEISSKKIQDAKYITDAAFSLDAKKEALAKEPKFKGLTLKDLTARKIK